MNVRNLDKKEKNQAEITVEISAEEFESAVNSAYKKSRNSIAIPGFRKGKAPRKMIENMYGTSVFYEDALDILYPTAYEFAVTEQNLNVVGQPAPIDVDITDEKVVTIKYLVSLYPEVSMKEYKGLSAPKPAVKVLKKEIDDEIELIRKRNARIETVDRAAKDGDTANIDYEGFLEGVPFEGGKDTGHNLVLGSGQFIPGFEDQVIGMKPGEERDIDITFPEDYMPDLAGKAVVFKIKLNEVKESVLPELDDEFAKDVSEFDTLEEYKASVKESISERKKAETEQNFKDAIFEKVIEALEADIPEAMIEARIDSTIQNYNYNLSAQGLSFDMYMQMMGMDVSEFRTTMRPSCEKQVQLELAFEKIAELEGIEVSEEDIDAEYTRLATAYGMEADAVKKSVPSESIVHQLKLDRAEEIVVSAAVVEKKTTKKAEKTEETTEE